MRAIASSTSLTNLKARSASRFRTSLQLRDIPQELPDETHISSAQRITNAAQSLFARNRLDLTGAHFVSPSLRFR